MIQTFSKFYYDTTITSSTNLIDFDEGGGPLQAQLIPSGYSLSELVVEVQRALNDAGTLTYTVTVNRDTRVITISGSATFSLLLSTGSGISSSPWSTLGFNQTSDLTGASSYSGNSDAGKEYKPQFQLQDYVDKEDQQAFIDATVRRSASGQVEVTAFGTEKFYDMNIKWATNFPVCSPFRNNPTGIEDLRDFMQFITTKAKFEFIPDVDDTSTFDKVLLESAPGNNQGTGYKLRELFNQNVPGWYETGILKLRVFE